LRTAASLPDLLSFLVRHRLGELDAGMSALASIPLLAAVLSNDDTRG